MNLNLLTSFGKMCPDYSLPALVNLVSDDAPTADCWLEPTMNHAMPAEAANFVAEFFQVIEGQTSSRLFPHLGSSGWMEHGHFSTVDGLASHSADDAYSVSSLRDILERNVAAKYFLSPRACLGILKRAEKRGRELPAILQKALRAVSDLPTVDSAVQISVSEGLEPTLRSEAHGNIPSIIAIQNGARPREYSQGLGVTEDGSMYTLDTFGEHAGLHVPDEAPVYAFDSKTSQSFQVDEDVSPTVKVGSATAGGAPPPAVFSVDDPAAKHAADESKLVVAFDTAQITSNVNRTRVEPGLPSSTLASNSQMHTAGAFGVRRLTPTECERLQAFPDGWTATDADGKAIADSARYRMLGNAVTVSTVRWIADRMYGVMNRDVSCRS